MSVTHFIGVAAIHVARSPDRVRTLLGSCVGVVLYDPKAKVGGVAHIMLPSSSLCHGHRGKFADTGVDGLLGDALSAGCHKERLRAKIAGGAAIFGLGIAEHIGSQNIQAVRERLAHHDIRLVAEDVGGTQGRRILFDPDTGQVEVEFNGGGASII